MTEKSITNECIDPTQSLNIEIPCALVERIERYAKENGSTVPGIMIEALDRFLWIRLASARTVNGITQVIENGILFCMDDNEQAG